MLEEVVGVVFLGNHSWVLAAGWLAEEAKSDAVLAEGHHLSEPKPEDPLAIQVVGARAIDLNQCFGVILAGWQTKCSQFAHGIESEDCSGDDACDVQAAENVPAWHAQDASLEIVGAKSEDGWVDRDEDQTECVQAEQHTPATAFLQGVLIGLLR